METVKLYYQDPHIRRFSACVESCVSTDSGFEITLNATAFYPEGGGQACDLGTLGAARVLSVREAGEAVIHLCDQPLPVGETVCGSIDWERRFDLMQQHTGEHIVSGILHKYLGCHNTGFHVGEYVMEVDFSCPVDAQLLAKVEREANEAVWANLPLKCWYPSPEELPNVTYRTKRALPWPVRIVQIPGVDSCACCGVHVSHTGEVGVIKILSCVKFHGGIRLEMVCGGRAFDWYSHIFQENKQVSQLFSAKITETGEAARKMAEQLAAEKFRSAALEKRLLQHTADAYRGKNRPVLRFEEGLSGGNLRELAGMLAQSCGHTAAVLSPSGEGFDVCLACPGADLKPLSAAMSVALKGRGGGKPGFFQGRLCCTREEAVTFFSDRDFLTESSEEKYFNLCKEDTLQG